MLVFGSQGTESRRALRLETDTREERAASSHLKLEIIWNKSWISVRALTPLRSLLFCSGGWQMNWVSWLLVNRERLCPGECGGVTEGWWGFPSLRPLIQLKNAPRDLKQHQRSRDLSPTSTRCAAPTPPWGVHSSSVQFNFNLTHFAENVTETLQTWRRQKRVLVCFIMWTVKQVQPLYVSLQLKTRYSVSGRFQAVVLPTELSISNDTSGIFPADYRLKVWGS